MAAPAEAPLAFITFNKGSYDVNLAALQLLSSVQGPLSIVAVAGRYRTGKSFLLNRLLGRQSGFEIGPTVQACTKGLYIWGQPRKGKGPDGQPLTYIFIDTEGLASLSADATHDAKIFSLAILLSSYFIYNSMGTIDGAALDSLNLVTHLAEHIQVRAGESRQQANLAPYLPAFLWVVRDFTLQLRDEEGREITEKDYLEKALQPTTQPGPDGASKNDVRRAIRSYFPARDCMTLVRPVADERQLQNLAAVPYEKMRPEFRAKMELLQQKVLSEAGPKLHQGTALSGPGYAALVRTFLEQLRRGAVPSLADGWAAAVAGQAASSLRAAVDAFAAHLQTAWPGSAPIQSSSLSGHLDAAEAAARRVYQELYLGAPKPEHVAALDEALKERRATALSANARMTRGHSEAQLKELFGGLLARLQQGKLASTADLLADWSKISAELDRSAGDAEEKAAALRRGEERLRGEAVPALERRLAEQAAARLREAEAARQEQLAKAHAAELAAASMKGELAAASARAEAATKQVQQLEGERATLRAQVARLEEEVARARADARRAEEAAALLRTELHTAQTALAAARAESVEKTRELGGAATEREAAKKAQEKLQTLRESLAARDVSLRQAEEYLAAAREAQRRAEQEAQRLRDQLHAAPAAAAAAASVPPPAPAAAGPAAAPAPVAAAEPPAAKGKRARGADSGSAAKKARGAPAPAAAAAEADDDLEAELQSRTIPQLRSLLVDANVYLPPTKLDKKALVALCMENAAKVAPVIAKGE